MDVQSHYYTLHSALSNISKDHLTKVKRRLHHPMVEWSEVFARNFVDIIGLPAPTHLIF